MKNRKQPKQHISI